MVTLLAVKQGTRIGGDIHARINARAKVPARHVSTADNVYCPSRSIRNVAQNKQGYGGIYTVRTAGEIVEIKAERSQAHKGYERDRGSGSRGVVREFSQKSRRRLAKVCAAISWGSFPFLFVTLTYPAEFVTDGEVCARHLDNFRRAWAHHYGVPLAVWKREYQRRGAVHFHLAILRPPEVVPLVEVQRWARLTWSRIVGAPARVEAVPLRRPPVAYFSSHGQHGRDKKGYQNEVPEGFRNPGRFWGTWGLAPDWHETDLSVQEFVELRRIMRSWAKSRRIHQRLGGGRLQGLWVRSRRVTGYQLGADFLRATRLSVT